MMSIPVRLAQVRAVVEEVLPSTGLAFLTDGDEVCWAVTKSTPGSQLGLLRPGQQVDLTVSDHGSFSVVSSYAPLD